MNLLAVAQTLVISLVLADVVFPKLDIVAFRKEIAHAIGIAVPVVTSYFGHKYWTFGARVRQSSQTGGDV